MQRSGLLLRSFLSQKPKLPWRFPPFDPSFTSQQIVSSQQSKRFDRSNARSDHILCRNESKGEIFRSSSVGSIVSSEYCLKSQRCSFLSFGDGDEDSGLSKKHEETRIIGYSPEQLFSVVAAVDLYEDFVPWCQKSTILWQNESALEAELEIGFKFLVERYVSHVELKRPTLIKTSVSKSNIFEYLTNTWEFKPGPVPGSCNLQFSVSFQFRSPLYRQVASMFFEEVVARLVGSFEGRCKTVYGPSVKVLEDAQTA